VFPPVVADFADGRFAVDDHGTMLFLSDEDEWIPASTVEYGQNGTRTILS
jgi:hypothetical protein